MISWLLIWLGVGFFSTICVIKVFRKNGRLAERADLYLSAIGPFFGPIVIILLLLDMYSQYCMKKEEKENKNGKN